MNYILHLDDFQKLESFYFTLMSMSAPLQQDFTHQHHTVIIIFSHHHRSSGGSWWSSLLSKFTITFRKFLDLCDDRTLVDTAAISGCCELWNKWRALWWAVSKSFFDNDTNLYPCNFYCYLTPPLYTVLLRVLIIK